MLPILFTNDSGLMNARWGLIGGALWLYGGSSPEFGLPSPTPGWLVVPNAGRTMIGTSAHEEACDQPGDGGDGMETIESPGVGI